jgi:gliding motility-associated-like protein
MDEQICFGEDITLAATGGISYNWFDGTQWLTNITNEITFNMSSDASFIVEGEDLNGCLNTDTVIVFVNASQVPILNTEASVICIGESVQLANLNTNAEATGWYFSNGTESIGQNNPDPFVFNDVGCYDLSLTMVDNNGCDTSLSFNNVVCVEEPVASFYTNPSFIGPGNGEVYFFNTSVGAESYLWHYGDGGVSSLFEDVHTYDITQQTGYQATLIAFSSIGCQDSVSVPITYQEELIYYIPNSFTPDADEHNQTFKPIFTSGFDPFNYEIAIYNRWGEMIWKSFDHTQGWDGAYSSNQGIPVQEGQYSWVIKFKPKDTDGKVIIHGIVNVLK